jgi:hypothetical protein
LIVADAEGPAAVLDLFAKGDDNFAARATVLSLVGSDLDRLRAKLVCQLPDIPSLLQNFAECMEQATMGTAIYIAGAESFLGEAVRRAAGYGIAFSSLRTELRGSIARRVQCVHCKSTTEQVLTPTVTCTHCQRSLMVRDHFSHRLNAYMGVSIDAEDAGT